jgi:hypothetical protein
LVSVSDLHQNEKAVAIDGPKATYDKPYFAAGTSAADPEWRLLCTTVICGAQDIHRPPRPSDAISANSGPRPPHLIDRAALLWPA